MRAAVASLLAAALACGPLPCRSAPCRDRTKQPFASSSIWNTPIGANAVFRPAGLFHAMDSGRACALRASAPQHRVACGAAGAWASAPDCEASGCCHDAGAAEGMPRCFERADAAPYPQQFHNDADWVIAAKASDPQTPWISQGDWGPDDHCKQTGPVATTVPFPADLVTGAHEENNAMGLLLPDGETLLQGQPLYRCGPGSPILAQFQAGCPVPFPWITSILGDGTWGAHGGSGLSAVGGTIRRGELNRTAPPIAHALKIEGYAHDQYYRGTQGQGWTMYTWPALGHDSYAATDYNGSNPLVRPGSLLALPADVAANLTLQTVPGQRLRDALRDYGAYIVDDTANPSGAVCMEAAVSDELEAEYGIRFGTYASGPAAPGTPMYDDLLALFQALHVVANNGPTTIGGGGAPRVPPAPPICGA